MTTTVVSRHIYFCTCYCGIEGMRVCRRMHKKVFKFFLDEPNEHEKHLEIHQTLVTSGI